MQKKEENNLEKIGIGIPHILFPREGISLAKWATIACDQNTSNPEYWEEVEKFVGDAPSTLKMQMPEAWLSDPAHQAHQDNIPSVMQQYLEDGTLEDLGEGFMFIHRQMSGGNFRRGLLVLLDLDKYEFTPGNKALCRATEDTIEERLAPRAEIRKKAPLEMPHVLVLINDKSHMLMNQLDMITGKRTPLYNFDLMEMGGRIRGWFINQEKDMAMVLNTLTMLKGASVFGGGMMYAVGDGNHSLAAAKKAGDRYALVEICDLNDPALQFYPIHRLVDADGNIVDYIHDKDECEYLAKERGLTAQIMPAYNKHNLWKDVLKNGRLPKKTFSIGNSVDKRYYLECHLR